MGVTLANHVLVLSAWLHYALGNTLSQIVEVFNFHVSYINHGRQVCRAQRPLCPECVVGALCPSRKKFMSKADLAALAEQEDQTPAGTAGAPMPHVPQPETQ